MCYIAMEHSSQMSADPIILIRIIEPLCEIYGLFWLKYDFVHSSQKNKTTDESVVLYTKSVMAYF